MANLHLDLIRQALEEDGADADITTLSTVPEQQIAAVSSRVSRALLRALPSPLRPFVCLMSVSLSNRCSMMATVQPGDVLAHLSGPARSLLSAERVALNFLGHLSGIATLTAQCAHAVEGTRARILDTRKTTPGLRTGKSCCSSAADKTTASIQRRRPY